MPSFKLRQARRVKGCFLFETCAQKWGQRVRRVGVVKRESDEAKKREREGLLQGEAKPR